MPKKQVERPKDKPYSPIIHTLLDAGIEVRDCTVHKDDVPMLLCRCRDVPWWLAIHQPGADVHWKRGAVGHFATTKLCVAIVANAQQALERMQRRLPMPRWQHDRLNELYLNGGDGPYTPRQIAEYITREGPNDQLQSTANA